MATIESIIVNLKANSAAFVSGLGKGQTALGKFSKFLKSTKGQLLTALSAIGVGLGVDAFKDMAQKFMETTDASNKMATAMNMSTQELTALQYAADRIGNVSAEDMNSALTKLTKSIGDATDAGSPAAKALDELGVSLGSLIGLPANEQFTKIAEGLGKITDQNTRARIAGDLFGKSWATLNPLFSAGAAGIKEFTDQAKGFNLAINDLDVAKVTATKDVYENMGAQFTGLKNTLLVELIPAIQAIGETFLGIIPGVDGFQNSVQSGVQNSVSSLGTVVRAGQVVVYGLRAVANAILLIYQGLYLTGWTVNKTMADLALKTGLLSKAQYDDMQKAAKEGNDTITRLVKDNKDAMEEREKVWFGGQDDLGDKLVDNYADAKKRMDQIAADSLKKQQAAAAKAQADAQAKFGQGILDQTNGLGVFNWMTGGATNKVPKDIEAAAKAYEAAQKKMDDEGKSLAESLRTPFEIFQDSIAKYQELLDAQAITPEVFQRAVDKAQADLDAAGEKADDHKAAMVTRRWDCGGVPVMPAKRPCGSRWCSVTGNVTGVSMRPMPPRSWRETI